MQLTIKTDIFKEMVSRSIKGASQNKLIPLTSLMAIQLKDNVLTLITSDASNYLYINQDNVAGDEFYVVVEIEQFSKLIGKMTCENITLEVEDKILKVKGNGDYKIELPLDEEGNAIIFPDPVAKVKKPKKKPIEIDIATFRTILNTIKPALAATMEVPVYTRYYMGEIVMATDTYKISSLNADVLHTDPLLMAADTMNLLEVMTCEKIAFQRVDDILLFTTPDCIVYGHEVDGVNDYQIDKIGKLLKQQLKSKCKLDRNALLAILDRIGLFVGQYDNKAIILTFTETCVEISSKASTGVEILNYIESEEIIPCTCNVDIDMLSTQLKASAAETIQMQFGDGKSLRFVDGNITQMISLLYEE